MTLVLEPRAHSASYARRKLKSRIAGVRPTDPRGARNAGTNEPPGPAPKSFSGVPDCQVKKVPTLNARAAR